MNPLFFKIRNFKKGFVYTTIFIGVILVFSTLVFASAQRISVDQTLVHLGDTVTVTIEGETSDLGYGVIVKVYEDDLIYDDPLGEQIVEYKNENGKAVAKLKWVTQEQDDGWGLPEFRFKADELWTYKVNTKMANPGIYLTNIPNVSAYQEKGVDGIPVGGTNIETAAEGIFVKKIPQLDVESIAGSVQADKYQMIENLTLGYQLSSSAINFAQAIPSGITNIRMLFVAGLTEVPNYCDSFPSPGNISSWAFDFWERVEMSWNKEGYGKIIIPSEIWGPGDVAVKAMLVPSIDDDAYSRPYILKVAPQLRAWRIRAIGTNTEQIINLGNFYLSTGETPKPEGGDGVRVPLDMPTFANLLGNSMSVAEVKPQEKIQLKSDGEYTVVLEEKNYKSDSWSTIDSTTITVKDETKYYILDPGNFLTDGSALQIRNEISNTKWIVYSSEKNIPDTISGIGNTISALTSGMPSGSYILQGKGEYNGSRVGYAYIFYKDGNNYYVDPEYTPTPPAEPSSKILSIAKTGSGSGTVESSPIGISCGSDCSKDFDEAQSVTLTAQPSGDSEFQVGLAVVAQGLGLVML